MSNENAHPYTIGGKVFIRTVTNYYTGTLKAVYDNELVLTDCSWVACTGRFSNALDSGELDEVEPYPEGDVIIGRGPISDCSVWKHELPRKTT